MSQCWWPCFCRPFRLAGFATTHTKEQIIADALNELPVLLPPVDRHSRNTHTRPVIKLDCPTCGRQYSKSRAQINSTSETLGLGGIRRLTQNEKLRRRTCCTRTAARKNEIIVNKPAERERPVSHSSCISLKYVGWSSYFCRLRRPDQPGSATPPPPLSLFFLLSSPTHAA